MNPEDVEDVEDSAALDAMNSGFDQPATPDPTTPPAKEVKGGKAPEVPAKVETPPATPAPEYVQITKEQFASFESAAAKVTEFGPKLDRALGTFGNVQQIVKDLQAATPKGMEIELPPDVVSEMEAEFPEIADHLRKSLAKALKGLRGTGGEKGAGLDQDAINKLVSEGRSAYEVEALEDAHPKWREIVGAVDAAGNPDANHPFRKWLAEQPAEYQQKINSTHNAAIISRAIDKFQAAIKTPPAKEPKPPEGNSRREVLRAAVQPKGDGGQSPPANSAEDPFLEGFKSG
jgi:hypothetical protein